MKKIFVFLTKALLVLTFISFNSNIANGEETELILQHLEVLQKDIKTLEKAVYSQDYNATSNKELSGNSSDVLTKHLI